jgi:hypothetical protein
MLLSVRVAVVPVPLLKLTLPLSAMAWLPVVPSAVSPWLK